MQNLEQLLSRLIKAHVEFVLVGGFAGYAHGTGMSTRDLDICC